MIPLVIIFFKITYSFGAPIRLFFDRGRFQHFSDIGIALLLGVSLTDHQTSKMCWVCKEDLESNKDVTLEISCLRAMVKRRRGKQIAAYVCNCDRKKSGKFDIDDRLCCRSTGQESSTA